MRDHAFQPHRLRPAGNPEHPLRRSHVPLLPRARRPRGSARALLRRRAAQWRALHLDRRRAARAAAAKLSLERAGVDAGAALAGGSLILRDFSEWYAEGTRLRGAGVVDLWLAEEARALADGCAGLRITGNVTFLTPVTWSVFMEYEDLLTKAFSGRRIVTLCTYPSERCGASNVLDVVHRHSCTLEHPDEGWQILTRIPS